MADGDREKDLTDGQEMQSTKLSIKELFHERALLLELCKGFSQFFYRKVLPRDEELQIKKLEIANIHEIILPKRRLHR